MIPRQNHTPKKARPMAHQAPPTPAIAPRSLVSFRAFFSLSTSQHCTGVHRRGGAGTLKQGSFFRLFFFRAFRRFPLRNPTRREKSWELARSRTRHEGGYSTHRKDCAKTTTKAGARCGETRPPKQAWPSLMGFAVGDTRPPSLGVCLSCDSKREVLGMGKRRAFYLRYETGGRG